MRKKKPQARPTPIVHFQDYTRAMTPMDRYRKHALMFDYWNAELLDALAAATPNPKRLKRAAAESRQELTVLQGLLQADLAAQLDPLIADRTRWLKQLERDAGPDSQRQGLRRAVETQTRQFHRQFSWRDVEDFLRHDAAVSGAARPSPPSRLPLATEPEPPPVAGRDDQAPVETPP